MNIHAIFYLCPLLLAAAPIPVQVNEVSVRGNTPDLTLLAEDLTDTVRRALGASGEFVVVRTDLQRQLVEAQRRYLSDLYDEKTAPEVGRFQAAKVLVQSTLSESENRYQVIVTMVDIETGATRADLKVGVARPDRHRLAAELTLALAERLGDRKLNHQSREQLDLLLKNTLSAAAAEQHAKGRRALRRLSSKSLKTAKDAFREAIRLDPDFAVAYADLAHAEYWSAVFFSHLVSDYEQSRAALLAGQAAAQNAQRLAPNLGIVQRELARIYCTEGQKDLCHASLARAHSLLPNDATLWVLDATMTRSKAKAEEKYRQAVSLDPASIEPRLSLAAFYREQEQLSAARETYLTALREVDPQNALLLVALAEVEAALGHLTEAKVLGLKALQVDPTMTLAQYNLGWVKVFLDEDGWGDIEAALAQSPGLGDQTGADVAHAQTHRESIRRHRALHQRYPANAAAILLYARSLAASDDQEDRWNAANLLDQYGDRIPAGHLAPLLLRAWVFSRAGRVGAATKDYEKAVSMAKNSNQKAHFAIKLVGTLLAEGQHARARAEASRLSTERSHNVRAEAFMLMGESYRMEGELDSALRFYTQALELMPDFESVEVGIAMTYRLLRIQTYAKLLGTSIPR